MPLKDVYIRNLEHRTHRSGWLRAAVLGVNDGLVSRGDLGPFRVKIRSASFNNISITPWLLRGVYVPDIVTILASLYFILGDIAR